MSNETIAPKVEKTDAEVAAQIKRIGDKLKSRADSANLDPVASFGIFEGGERLARSGSKQEGLTYITHDYGVDSSTELHEDGSLTKSTKASATSDQPKKSDEFGVGNGQVDGQDKVSGYEYVNNGQAYNELTKDQIINRSAIALNELRSKVNERTPEK